MSSAKSWNTFELKSSPAGHNSVDLQQSLEPCIVVKVYTKTLFPVV